MLLTDCCMVLATAAAPGTVSAPAWLLPTCACATLAMPLAMVPLARTVEADRKQYETVAPSAEEGHAHRAPKSMFVAPAGAKGQGLFAAEPIPKATYLFDYTGELLTHSEYLARYPDSVSDYTAALRHPQSGTMHFIDGRDVALGSPSRWMNHASVQPNVGRRSFFPPDGSAPRILMYALRNMDVGDELQWDYGDGYWAARGGLVE